MAIGFERQQKSLIGANLPTARLDIQPADFSGLRRLGNDIMNAGARIGDERARRAEEGRGMQDTLAGSEQGSLDGMNWIGKDENGKPREFTLPAGSPAFQRAYVEAFSQSQDARFRNSLETEFNRIQQQFVSGEITAADADRLMREHAKGQLEGTPTFRRGYYSELAEVEILQRSGLMGTQEANQRNQLATNDLIKLIEDRREKGAAHASAGGDPEPFMAEIDKAYDTLVGMNRIGPEEAAIGKKSARQLVAGQALINRITTALEMGEIDPSVVDQFGTAVETNNSKVEAVVMKGYQVGPNARSSVPQGYRSKDVLTKIEDPRLQKEIGLKLRQAAADYQQRIEAHAKNRAFADVYDRLGTLDGRFVPVPADMKDDSETYVQWLLADKQALDTPEGMKQLRSALQRFKFAPKGLVSTLRNMTNSGEASQIEKAIQVYQMMTTLQNQWGDDIGRVIYNDIPESDREALDAFRDAYEYGVPVLDIREAMKRLRGGNAITMGDAIRAYNAAKGTDEKGFDSAFRDKWTADFGQSYPIEAEDAFRRAYRVNLALTGDAGHAFDKAYEAVKGRFTTSDVFLRGTVKTGMMPPTNPYGYETERKTPFGGNAYGSEYEWLEKEIRTDLASTRLAKDPDLTPEKLAELLNLPKPESAGAYALGWTSPDFLGKTVKLEPTGTSPTQPEFMLRIFDERGIDMGYLEVEGPNGKPRPYTINPWERHAQLTQQAIKAERLTKLVEARDATLLESKQRVWELYTGRNTMGGGFRPMPEDDAGFAEFLQTIEPVDREKYQLERQQILDGFDRQQQKLEEQGGIEPSKTKALDQTSLVTPGLAGFNVTANAVAAVESVIPDGTGGQFMMRVAAHESNFGKANGTFRKRGDRGIFQVNTGSGFVEVVRQARSGSGRVYEAAQKLKDRLGIDIANLTPADLDKPVVAAAVGRLYFLVSFRDIPPDLPGQAKLWKDHYNTYLGAGTVAQFMRSAAKVPDDFSAAAFLNMDRG